MRAVLVFLALAGSVRAAPVLRWLDATGGLQAAGVKRLIEESGTSLKVELEPLASDPRKTRVLTIPLTKVLEFVREDDRDEEQKRLLGARTRVRAGVDLKAASATLDLLSEKGREEWVREYAAAFRAIAGRKLAERDAAKRMTAFLRAHPKSRFVCEVLRERAWAESLQLTDPIALLNPFGEAFKEVGKRGGPFRVQYWCIRDAAQRNVDTQVVEMSGLLRTLRSSIKDVRPDASAAELTVRYSGDAERRILTAAYKWREAVEAELPTDTFKGHLGEIENGADLLLPDTRVNLRLEQAALAMAGKQFGPAQRYLGLASREQASLVQRLLIRRAEDQLKRLREKR